MNTNIVTQVTITTIIIPITVIIIVTALIMQQTAVIQDAKKINKYNLKDVFQRRTSFI